MFGGEEEMKREMWSIITAFGISIFFLMATSQASLVGTATLNYMNASGNVINIHGSFNESGYGGIYYLNKTAGTGDGSLLPNGKLDSFCIDLGQNSNTNSLVYYLQSPANSPIPGTPMGSARAELLRELWGRHFAQTPADSGKATAFSACVWEIVNETGALNVTNGSIWFDGGFDTTLANTWLGELNGTGPKANLVALTNETSQDYLVQLDPQIHVPEPAVISLLFFGGLAFLRRRKS
jgi:hypothetical protein